MLKSRKNNINIIYEFSPYLLEAIRMGENIHITN